MSERSSSELHVAIVGAGIAGLALAMALHRKGVAFTLYEEAKEYSTVGAGIGFSPNGMQAMDLIEPGFRPLYEDVCTGNVGENAQHIFFEGNLLAPGLGSDEEWYGESGWGHPDFIRKSAHRRTLLDIMTSFIPIENVKFNKRVIRIESDANGASLEFSDGTHAAASIVAGSDGIQSKTRDYVLRDRFPEQVDPVYAGAYCYRSVISMSEARGILGDLTNVAKFYFGRDRAVVTYRISGGKEFNFLHCVADPQWASEHSVTTNTTLESMLADFDDPLTVDSRLWKLLSKAKPVKWGLFHHKHTATYFRDRVAILGDSAHASLPFQAQGAGQGLEDALVLSNILAEINLVVDNESVIADGLVAYDSVRRPRAQKQVDRSAEVGKMIFFQHEDTGDNMDKIFSKLQAGWFDWLWFHDVEKDVQTALRLMKAVRGL